MTAAMIAAAALLVGAAAPKNTARPGRKAAKAASALPETRSTVKPLHERSFAEILANYAFVADLSPKPAEREVSAEVFWRYPYAAPPVDFTPEIPLADPRRELPATVGAGKPVDHMNRGRVLFLEKKYAEATATWLTGRARYGKEYPFHRRNDYLIALGFMNDAEEKRVAKGGDWQIEEVKAGFSNAATFLSWAFIVKADLPDPLLEEMAPKGLYNLAATYWHYGRYAGAYGAAEKGLEFLRRTGRSEYRHRFLRIAAESHIKNLTYLEALQNLDLAIRQDPVASEAAAAFARAGDIYFDLNNYDLAVEAYRLGARIDEDQGAIDPAQLVLLGESLFWLGEFDEALKMLHFGLEGRHYRKPRQPLPEEFAGWAGLRIADAWLAQAMRARDKLPPAVVAAIQQTKPGTSCGDQAAGGAAGLREYCGLLDKARLEYYRVGHTYRGQTAGRVAKVRSACLELPDYLGNNIKHARELLEQGKEGGGLPPIAQEIAWSCQVASYTDRERTPEMLERVRAFAGAHPESRFLAQFAEPVREFQASHLEPMLDAGETHKAISFFEQTRANLFPTVNPSLGAKLFAAYADTGLSAQAAEFWEIFSKTPDTDLKLLRQVTVATELAQSAKGGPWPDRETGFVNLLPRRSWNLPPTEQALSYVTRLRVAPSAARHLPWLANLARVWSAASSAHMCDYEYPILSQLFQQPKHRESVHRRLGELIAANLPELFKHDESCSLSLLELEASAMRSDTRALAARYLARTDWPLVGGYLHLYWMIAEHINEAGDRDSAKAMWTVIKKSGPGGSPEVRFATARLDPTRTEFDKLWD